MIVEHKFLILFFVCIGILMDYLNNIGIKITTKKILNEKKQSIILFSFFIRLSIIMVLFYFITFGNFVKAISIVFGFTLSKVFFIIKNNVKVKDANINR